MEDWTITTSPVSGTSGTTSFSITASSAESDDNLAIIKLCNTEKDVAGYVSVSQDEEK